MNQPLNLLKRRDQNDDRAGHPTHPLINKYLYRANSRFFAGDDMVFLNWGYEEDPPMAVPLAESDEADRYSIQLYHRVATQVDLAGKRVLEVSCGHGGGASYLTRTQGPASYTGLDLNPVGLEFCRKKHQLPNLDFVEGNAEELAFPDESFDVVINVEASHCYPRFAQFLNEVERVLRPGGHFLYADARRSEEVAEWDEKLASAPLRLVSETPINESVARGMEKVHPGLYFKMPHRIWATINFMVFAHLYRRLQDNKTIYRMYHFVKE